MTTRARWFIAGAITLLALAAAPIGSVVTSAPIYGRGTAQDPIRIVGVSSSGNATTATALAANGTNCAAGQFSKGVDQSGNAEGCAAVTSAETDPQVGTIVGASWCTGNDAGNVVCNQAQPVLTEVDPRVYAQSGPGLICKGDGEGVECEYLMSDLETDPRLPHCTYKQTILGTDAGTYACSDQVDPAYGHIEEAHAGKKIKLTAAETYYPWTTGNCRDVYNMICATGGSGDAGTAVTSYLEITQAGEYRVSFNSSITASGNNKNVEADLFIVPAGMDGGVAYGETEKCATSSKFGSADEQSLAFGCVVNLNVGDRLSVRFDAESGSEGTTITLDHSSLTVTNVAPTVAVGEFTGNYVESVATSAPLSGGAAAGQATAISLTLNDCGQGKILKSGDGGWNCVAAPFDLDGLGCGEYEFPKQVGGVWACSDQAESAVSALVAFGVTASCPAGQVLTSGDAGLSCVSEADPLSYHVGSLPLCAATQTLTNSDAGVSCVAAAGETDPQVGTLIATRWCTGTDAGTVECKETAPVLAEVDPQVGTLTADLWCRSNSAGTAVVCNSIPSESDPTLPAVSGCATGTLLTSGDGGWLCSAPASETDPQVGTVSTSGLWCAADGTKVECDKKGIPQTCTTGQRPFWSGSAWVCYGTHVLLSDVEETTTNWTDITGLNVTAGANGWIAVDCALGYDVGNSGTGLALGLNGPAGSSVSYETWVFHNATIDTSAHGTADFCNSNSLAAGSAGCSPTTSTTTDSVVYRAGLRGLIKLGSTSGTVALRARGNNVDSFWRIKSGSWCRFDFVY